LEVQVTKIEEKKRETPALLFVLVIGAGLAASFAFGGGSKGATVGLRASLVGQAQPARGIFVATLLGRSLRWSLAYRGLSPNRPLSAWLLPRNSARPTRLCGSCPTLVRGRVRVSPTLARALTHRRALVELRPAGASTPALAGTITVQEVPVLKIASPKPGQTITLPAEISYSISGVVVRQESGPQLEVFIAGGEGSHVKLALSSTSGTVTLPDVKDAFLVGHRDLTFRLLNADGVPLPNPEATVVVRDLTIQGRRSGACRQVRRAGVDGWCFQALLASLPPTAHSWVGSRAGERFVLDVGVR
jgi:hypothetical protein